MTLPSDPVCAATDGMTYQEKIDILSGSVNDCHNQPDYFDYDEPCDIDDICVYDGPAEFDRCCDLHEPDVSGGEDISYRARLDDQFACVASAPGPDGTGDGNQPPSSGAYRPGDPGRRPTLTRRNSVTRSPILFLYWTGWHRRWKPTALIRTK